MTFWTYNNRLLKGAKILTQLKSSKTFQESVDEKSAIVLAITTMTFFTFRLICFCGKPQPNHKPSLKQIHAVLLKSWWNHFYCFCCNDLDLWPSGPIFNKLLLGGTTNQYTKFEKSKQYFSSYCDDTRQRRRRQDNNWNTNSVLYFRNPDDTPSPAQHCPVQSSAALYSLVPPSTV